MYNRQIYQLRQVELDPAVAAKGTGNRTPKGGLPPLPLERNAL